MKNIVNLESLWGFIVTALFSIVFWLLHPYQAIPAWQFVLVFFFLLVVIWLAGMLYLKMPENIKKSLLAIKIHSIHSTDSQFPTIVLLSPNEMLFSDSFVTIHKRVGKLEIYIATGKVLMVQQDKFIQVEIIKFENLSVEEFKNIDFESIVVRLGVSSKLFEEDSVIYRTTNN